MYDIAINYGFILQLTLIQTTRYIRNQRPTTYEFRNFKYRLDKLKCDYINEKLKHFMVPENSIFRDILFRKGVQTMDYLSLLSLNTSFNSTIR